MNLRRFHSYGDIRLVRSAKLQNTTGGVSCMSKYLMALIVLLITTLPASGSVEKMGLNNDIDVVWSSSDGLKTEIYYSQRKDGIWQEPVQVTDDHYNNLYPVIDRDSNGTRWIFWTAHERGRMDIHYTTGNGDEWQNSEILSSGKKSNFSPSMVIDTQDKVWVVWSANNDDLDDIMYAFYQNGSWSDPATVHEPNSTPDLLPVVEIGGDGTPQVSWRAAREGQNVVLSSKWFDTEWSEPHVEEAADSNQEEGEEKIIELPHFVNRTSMVFVRVY